MNQPPDSNKLYIESTQNGLLAHSMVVSIREHTNHYRENKESRP